MKIIEKENEVKILESSCDGKNSSTLDYFFHSLRNNKSEVLEMIGTSLFSRRAQHIKFYIRTCFRSSMSGTSLGVVYSFEQQEINSLFMLTSEQQKPSKIPFSGLSGL
jgi:hypothetical protein